MYCSLFRNSNSSSSINSLKSKFRSSIEKLKSFFKIANASGNGGSWKRVPAGTKTKTTSSNKYFNLNLKDFCYSDESESLIHSHSQSNSNLQQLKPFSSSAAENCGDFQNININYQEIEMINSSAVGKKPKPTVMKRITHQLIDDEVPLIKF